MHPQMAGIRRSQADCSHSAGGLHRLEGVYCEMFRLISGTNADSEYPSFALGLKIDLGVL